MVGRAGYIKVTSYKLQVESKKLKADILISKISLKQYGFIFLPVNRLTGNSIRNTKKRIF